VNAVALAAETPLDGLLGVDTGELSDRELIEAMMVARRLASRVQAVELAAVAELARRRFAEELEGGDAGGAGVEVVPPREYVQDEVAEALTITSVSADELVRVRDRVEGAVTRHVRGAGRW
jgi:hypothetical protein